MVLFMVRCKKCGNTDDPEYIYKKDKDGKDREGIIDKIVCSNPDCKAIMLRVWRKYVHGSKMKKDDEDDPEEDRFFEQEERRRKDWGTRVIKGARESTEAERRLALTSPQPTKAPEPEAII